MHQLLTHDLTQCITMGRFGVLAGFTRSQLRSSALHVVPRARHELLRVGRQPGAEVERKHVARTAYLRECLSIGFQQEQQCD